MLIGLERSLEMFEPRCMQKKEARHAVKEMEKKKPTVSPKTSKTYS